MLIPIGIIRLVALTVAAFAAGARLYQHSGKMEILQPALIAILLMSVLLVVTRFP